MKILINAVIMVVSFAITQNNVTKATNLPAKKDDKDSTKQVMIREDGFIYINGIKVEGKDIKKYQLKDGTILYATKGSIYSVNKPFVLYYFNQVSMLMPSRIRIYPKYISRNKVTMWLLNFFDYERNIRFKVGSQIYQKQFKPNQIIEIFLTRNPTSGLLVLSFGDTEIKIPGISNKNIELLMERPGLFNQVSVRNNIFLGPDDLLDIISIIESASPFLPK